MNHPSNRTGTQTTIGEGAGAISLLLAPRNSNALVQSQTPLYQQRVSANIIQYYELGLLFYLVILADILTGIGIIGNREHILFQANPT